MGNMCAPVDIYEQVKQQQGQQFQKFVIVQEIRKALRLKVNQFHQRIKRVAKSLQDQAQAKTSLHQQNIKDKAQECMTLINRHYLGGVKGLQAQRKCKVQQILGCSSIQQRYKLLRQTIIQKITADQLKMQKKWQQIRKLKYEQINKEEPILQFFNLLPVRIRQDIYIRATKEYKQKIQALAVQFINPLQKAFSQKYINKLQITQHQKELQSLTSSIQSELAQRLSSLIGNDYVLVD